MNVGRGPVVQHARQDVLRVLETLGHFGVVRVERQREGHHGPFSFFVYVGDEARLRIEQDLGLVLEVYLHDFVGKTEHRGMGSPHPLFNVNRTRLHFYLLQVLRLRTRLHSVLAEVGLKVLEKRHFFLQIFRVVLKTVSRHNILLLRRTNSSALVVVEHDVVLRNHDFGAVVEKHTGRVV